MQRAAARRWEAINIQDQKRNVERSWDKTPTKKLKVKHKATTKRKKNTITKSSKKSTMKKLKGHKQLKVAHNGNELQKGKWHERHNCKNTQKQRQQTNSNSQLPKVQQKDSNWSKRNVKGQRSPPIQADDKATAKKWKMVKKRCSKCPINK